MNIREFQIDDLSEISEIFNQFINDFAIYPEVELNEEEFASLLKNARFILVVGKFTLGLAQC